VTKRKKDRRRAKDEVEGRRKKEEGRRKKEEERRKSGHTFLFPINPLPKPSLLL
jgi:hypothetical protein